MYVSGAESRPRLEEQGHRVLGEMEGKAVAKQRTEANTGRRASGDRRALPYTPVLYFSGETVLLWGNWGCVTRQKNW